MTTLKSSLATLGAMILAVLIAVMPTPAMAEPGVANSEVTYSADGQAFKEIGPEGFAPRSDDGVIVNPGSKPNTKTTFIRHTTENVQKLDVLIAVEDLAVLKASRGNPSDFLITIIVDGVKSEKEYRFGDLFADGEPYGGDPNVRRVGPAIELTGAVGKDHKVEIQHRLPIESGNESQSARFIHNLVVIPEAPSPSPTPTETPSPTPTETDTPSPTPTDTPSPTPTETDTPSPTPTETDTPSPTPTSTPSPTATETETPSPTPTETDTPSPTPTETDTPSPTPTETATSTPSPTDTDGPRPTDKPTEKPGPPDDGDRPGPPNDDDRKRLPRTGADMTLGLGLGALLIGIGTAAALAARRRRS